MKNAKKHWRNKTKSTRTHICNTVGFNSCSQLSKQNFVFAPSLGLASCILRHICPWTWPQVCVHTPGFRKNTGVTTLVVNCDQWRHRLGRARWRSCLMHRNIVLWEVYTINWVNILLNGVWSNEFFPHGFRYNISIFLPINSTRERSMCSWICDIILYFYWP